MVNPTVVVTGMAWATALGTSLAGTWRRLLTGHSGLRPVPSAFPVRNPLAAATATPPAHWDPARRQVALAADTIRRAMSHAGLAPGAAGTWLVAGTSYGAHLDDAREDGLHEWVSRSAALAGVPGPAVAVTTACSSGSDAIQVAAGAIRSGAAQVCVCGGADVLTEAKRLGHSALGTMSPTLLRAFDPRADGTLLGEGAAFLVLESEQSARRRGATGYARFRAGGSTNDAAGMTSPDPSGDGVVAAIRRSLCAARLEPAAVAVVNAHGSGTPVNDAVEARSLGRLFPAEPRPVLFATKGALGHSLGATGAIEAVALILALRHGEVPPLYGSAPDPATFPLPVPVGAARRIGPGVGLSVTLGFGGFNTSLVFEGIPVDG